MTEECVCQNFVLVPIFFFMSMFIFSQISHQVMEKCKCKCNDDDDDDDDDDNVRQTSGRADSLIAFSGWKTN